MVVSGGSSGWLVKDYPGVQAVWSLVTGKPVPTGSTAVKDAEGVLAAKVSDLLNSTDQFDQPGTYQVTIPKVHLDSHLFKVGHTGEHPGPRAQGRAEWQAHDSLGNEALRRAAGRRGQG